MRASQKLQLPLDGRVLQRNASPAAVQQLWGFFRLMLWGAGSSTAFGKQLCCCSLDWHQAYVLPISCPSPAIVLHPCLASS